MALNQDKERVDSLQEYPHIAVLSQCDEALHLAEQPLLVIWGEVVKPRS